VATQPSDRRPSGSSIAGGGRSAFCAPSVSLRVMLTGPLGQGAFRLDSRLGLCRYTTMIGEHEPRLSLQTLEVLQAFLEQPKDQLSGADIRVMTGLASGTLYPILARLEESAWLQSEWENLDPSDAGRPRRRYYRITALGARRAGEAFRRIQFGRVRPAWAQ
jgi:PadR family transcriptional regulator